MSTANTEKTVCLERANRDKLLRIVAYAVLVSLLPAAYGQETSKQLRAIVSFHTLLQFQW